MSQGGAGDDARDFSPPRKCAGTPPSNLQSSVGRLTYSSSLSPLISNSSSCSKQQLKGAPYQALVRFFFQHRQNGELHSRGKYFLPQIDPAVISSCVVASVTSTPEPHWAWEKNLSPEPRTRLTG